MRGIISIILITILISAFLSGCVEKPKTETTSAPTATGTAMPVATGVQTPGNYSI